MTPGVKTVFDWSELEVMRYSPVWCFIVILGGNTSKMVRGNAVQDMASLVPSSFRAQGVAGLGAECAVSPLFQN